MKTSVKYRIHRTIALVVVPLLVISTVTGFFKANQKWYWEPGYKKKKQPSVISVENELVSTTTLLHLVDSVSKKKNKYQEIALQAENENVYYKLITESKEKFLVDAYTGKIVSPLSDKLASDFATQYVKGNPEIKLCEYVENFVARKGKEKRAVYKVVFNNKVNSEIYLDYYTGEIVEDIDDNRRFGIWVMRLHEFDFFDSKREITSGVGIGIFLLALSGLWLYRIRLMKKKSTSVAG